MPVAVILRGGGEPSGSHVCPHGRLGLVTQLPAAATWVWEPERHMFAAGTWLFRPEAASLGQPHSFTTDRKEEGHPRRVPARPRGLRGDVRWVRWVLSTD